MNETFYSGRGNLEETPYQKPLQGESEICIGNFKKIVNLVGAWVLSLKKFPIFPI